MNALNQAMDAHEGCNLAGWLDVQRVAGNFHISVHAEEFLLLTKARRARPRLRGGRPGCRVTFRVWANAPCELACQRVGRARRRSRAS